MDVSLSSARLRPWRPDDATALARHANSRTIWRTQPDRFPFPYTVADAEQWLRYALGNEAYFAIEVEGEAAGSIGLWLQDDISRLTAEIGYFLGEAHWGRGIVTEAVRTVTEYGFDHFGLVRVFALVFEDNAASVRVLEKAGYEFEGRLRRAVVKDGRILDRLLYACIRDQERPPTGS